MLTGAITPILGGIALPVAIFFVGGGMVFQKTFWKPLEFVPGCFIGCSTFFAVANSAQIGPNGPIAMLTAAVCALIFGDIIGWSSVQFANLMTSSK